MLTDLFHFDFSESFAKDADDVALRYKGIGVNLLDQTEDLHRLALVGQYHQHLDVVLGVPTDAIEHRYTAVCLLGDAVGYAFILLGEDKELHRLTGTVDYVVEYQANDKERNKTKDDPSPVAKDKVTGGDNHGIGCHHHAS